jgi:hypothetical protein
LGEFLLAFTVQIILMSVQGRHMYKCEAGSGSGALYYYHLKKRDDKISSGLNLGCHRWSVRSPAVAPQPLRLETLTMCDGNVVKVCFQARAIQGSVSSAS